MADSLANLRRLRELRERKPRDDSISGLIESQKSRAGKAQKQLGELAELWTELLPESLCARTTLMSMRGGVLHVAADSSSVSFELDRLLREGLLQKLRGRFGGTLTRVKVQLQTPDGNTRRAQR